MSEQNLIYKADGKPFANAVSASTEANRQNLDEEKVEVVEVEGGFAIKLNEPSDNSEFDDSSEDGSNGSKPKGKEVTTSEVANSNDPFGAGMKYRRVSFQGLADTSHTEDVPLILNGKVYKIIRGVQVVLPVCLLEVADNAQQPRFNQKPNQDRKELSPIQIYPYDDKGPATRAEYLQLLKEGSLKVQNHTR